MPSDLYWQHSVKNYEFDERYTVVFLFEGKSLLWLRGNLLVLRYRLGSQSGFEIIRPINNLFDRQSDVLKRHNTDV